MSADSEQPEFDHFLHVVPSVESTVEAYTAANLPAHVNQPLLGFQNGAWRLDERYVEILTVLDHELFATSPIGVSTADWMPEIDRVLAADGGPLNFAVNVKDVEATARRLREQSQEVEIHSFEFDEVSTSFKEAMLRDAPVWAPFFITYRPQRSDLLALIPPGRVERGPHELHGFEIEVPNPQSAAEWLCGVLQVDTDSSDVRIPLPGGCIHFVPGDADRITTMLLYDGEPIDTVINGLRIRVIDGH